MEHAHMKPAIGRKRNDSHSKAVIQMHLETTVPGDSWEQEADRAADMVTGTHGAKVSTGGAPAISAYGGTPVTISSRMESQFNALQGGGMSMPDSLRAQMQHGFGRDFSDVRLHTGREAAEMNSSLGSRAFTHGNDIYFNEGQYQPHTTEGRHLIAHELAHTIQQSGKVARFPYDGPTIGPDRRQPTEESDSSEARGYMSDALGFIAALSEILVDTSYFRTAWRERQAMAKIIGEAGKGANNVFAKFFKQGKAVFTSYDDVYKNAQKVAAETDKLTRNMDPAKILSKGVSGLKLGFDIFSYAFQVYDWSKKSVDAVNLAKAYQFDGPYTVSMCYTLLRLATCVADVPFSVYPPHVTAVLKAWNAGSAIGDVINDIMKWTGLDEWRLYEMRYMANAFGGSDTTMGNVAAAITSIQGVGEVIFLNTFISDQRQRFIREMIVKGYNMLHDDEAE